MKKIIYFCLLLPVQLGARRLPENITLPSLQKYAMNHVEFPAVEAQSSSNAMYAEFYRQQTPSMFRKLLTQSARNALLGVLERSVQQMVSSRELLGFGDEFIEKIIPPADAVFIIWGNLQGAFHSLVRGLTWLQEQGIIDDRLNILKQNYYFIFDANVIVRSPYTIETLLAVIALMRQNPHKVFYVQDISEHQENWHTDWFMEQLKGFANNDMEYVKNTLTPLLDRFFATLPYALYIGFVNDRNTWIRVAGSPQLLNVNENFVNGFFDNQMDIYRINNKKPVQHPVVFKAFLNASRLSNYYGTTGLTQLEHEQGVTTWGLFSSPTQYNQWYNNMYQDAFVVLNMAKNADEAVITLYNRDTRKSYPDFRARGAFYVASGLKRSQESLKKSQEQKQYVFGSTLDLSKSNAIMGMRLRKGMSLALMEHNVLGKTEGRDSFRVVVIDDEYTPQKSRQNIETLRNQNQINTFILPVGSPTVQASLDLIRSGSILMLFPVTGAPTFRKSDLKGIIHLRASYRDEVYALIPYLIKKHDAKKFLLFYQDDAYGKGPLDAARELLPLLGIKEWKEVAYNRNTTNFKQVVDEIRAFQPDALGLFSASASTKEMLREVGVESLINTKLFGISFLADDTFTKFVKDLGLPYIFAKSVPNPATSSLPLVQHYRELMDTAGLTYNSYSLEGYIATKLLITIVEKMGDKLVNHETLRHQFEALHNFDFQGLVLDFNPQTRELNNTVWLDNGATDWIEVRAAEARWKERFDGLKDSLITAL